MSTISNDDIVHLAALSSISLSPGEVESLREDIARIIEYINQLSELDTSGVEPTYQVTGLQNVWREDIVVPSVAPDQLVDLAPDTASHSMKVPKVL